MSKETGVIILGLWVFIVPFLGLPGSWRTVILVLSGMGIATLGFFLRAQALSDGAHSSAPSFRDSAHEPHVGEEVR